MLKRWCSPGTLRANAFVTPTAWLFLQGYRRLRGWALASLNFNTLAWLGPGAFDAVSGEIVNVVLAILTGSDVRVRTTGIDVRALATPRDKAHGLASGPLLALNQEDFTQAPDSRITPVAWSGGSLLEHFARGLAGLQSGDYPRFGRCFWEVESLGDRWERQQSTVTRMAAYGGREHIFMWERGAGVFMEFVTERLGDTGTGKWVRNVDLRGQSGIAVSSMGSLPATLFTGELFDNNVAVILPNDERCLPAIWAYCSSPEYAVAVRAIDQTLKVTNATLTKIPFDLDHWQKVAAEEYPNGLPEPHSDDLTQWLFKGNIVRSEAPLQVAVARLLGYRWPDQEPDELDALADSDGIVCLPSVSGEAPAAERLEKVLDAAYGAGWSAAKRSELLAATGGKAETLDAWLRDEFFEQHARLYHSRPFILQVWDGRRDGFSALLHYHRLDRATLEKLTYSQLGDWLERQRAGIAAGETGAEARLAAATELQRALANILEGEPPYDIYVRWKSLAEQPIGWEPDLDDGVRLNIRPFVVAGILRAKFTINWNKDRGTDPDGSERVNDLHFTVAQKRAARQ
jgi:hypothetical protein